MTYAHPRTAPRARAALPAALLVLALAACGSDDPGDGGAGDGAEVSDQPTEASVERGDLTEATLEIVGGAATIEVVAGDTDGALFRAVSADDAISPVPTETAEGEYTLDITYVQDSSTSALTVYLDPEVLWHLDVTGGSDTFEADLSEGRLGSLDVTAGSRAIELTLPAPGTEVPITQAGGAESFTVHLPEEASALVSFEAGFGSATVDGAELEPGPSGEATAGDPAAAERYVITNTGGLASFVLDRGPAS
jgi:hypothetical protein